MGLHSLTILLTTQTEYLPMFDLVLQTFMQMLPHLVSFGVLVLFFAKFLYKPVSQILQKRATAIENDITNAAQDNAAAQELKAMYEQKIRDVEIERATILEEARREAAARLDHILGEAKAEATGMKERASRDIITERERIRAGVHQAIVDISTSMVGKLIAASITMEDHESIFEDAIEELEATAFSAR